MNAMGILSGSLYIASQHFDRPRRTAYKVGLITLALLVLLACFRLPITFAAASYFQPRPPILANFDNRLALARIGAGDNSSLRITQSPKAWKSNESSVLEVSLRSGWYPGMRLLEPYSDWRGYETLSFDIYNPTEQTVHVAIRIDDAIHNNNAHDRFGRQLSLTPGENLIKISINDIRLLGDHYSTHRQMNLEQITSVVVFKSANRSNLVLYFDNFRLI